ncbi:MAG: hypothetical protein E7674_05000 [Ruminococcaceae bacterium]|nr:hypothetical protein [Oscillospiraceae bacterium]
MNYCEKCYNLCEDSVCEFCGNKKLRTVSADDYCFLIETEQTNGEMICDIFEQEGIKHTVIPTGNGVRSNFGLSLENYEIYVQYKSLDLAKETVNSFAEQAVSVYKNELLDNFEKWFIAKPKYEEKWKKKLGLKDINIIEFSKSCVEDAEQIVDGGMVLSGTVGGHYYTVYSKKAVILFNSVSFEILSVEKA